MLVIIVEERGVRALVELDASEGRLGARAAQKGDSVQLAWEGFVNCSTRQSMGEGVGDGEGDGDGGQWTKVKSGELERCLRTSLSPRSYPLPLPLPSPSLEARVAEERRQQAVRRDGRRRAVAKWPRGRH